MSRKATGQILVRNIDDTLKNKLRRRAKRHGRSIEAEVRDILRDAVKDETKPRKGLGTEIADMFRGIGLTETIPELRGHMIKPPKFD